MSSVVKKDEFRVRIAWDCKQARVMGWAPGWAWEVEDCNEEENVGLQNWLWLSDRRNTIRGPLRELEKNGGGIAERGADARRKRRIAQGRRGLKGGKCSFPPQRRKSSTIDAIPAEFERNVRNPAQNSRGGYVSLFGGKEDHPPFCHLYELDRVSRNVA